MNVSTAGSAPPPAAAMEGMVATPKLLTPAEFAQKSSYKPQPQQPQQQQRRQPQPQPQPPRQSVVRDAAPPPPPPVSVSNDQIRALVSRLAANDRFIDIVAKELRAVLGSST